MAGPRCTLSPLPGLPLTLSYQAFVLTVDADILVFQDHMGDILEITEVDPGCFSGPVHGLTPRPMGPGFLPRWASSYLGLPVLLVMASAIATAVGTLEMSTSG